MIIIANRYHSLTYTLFQKIMSRKTKNVIMIGCYDD